MDSYISKFFSPVSMHIPVALYEIGTFHMYRYWPIIRLMKLPFTTLLELCVKNIVKNSFCYRGVLQLFSSSELLT